MSSVPDKKLLPTAIPLLNGIMITLFRPPTFVRKDREGTFWLCAPSLGGRRRLTAEEAAEHMAKYHELARLETILERLGWEEITTIYRRRAGGAATGPDSP